MARSLRLLLRLGLWLIVAAGLLLVGTLASFYAFGYLFGFSGHPAAPDLPSGCYVAYLLGAPVLALIASWLVLGRLARGAVD